MDKSNTNDGFANLIATYQERRRQLSELIDEAKAAWRENSPVAIGDEVVVPQGRWSGYRARVTQVVPVFLYGTDWAWRVEVRILTADDIPDEERDDRFGDSSYHLPIAFDEECQNSYRENCS